MIGDLFTPAQLKKAFKIYTTPGVGSVAKRLLTGIVVPRMEHINAVTGQQNDPMYMAYALEEACRIEYTMSAGGRPN